MPTQCEDAYFISDRAFGVSDGVSGWNDYGFSSDQFSLQLMHNAKKMVEKSIKYALDKNKNKVSKPRGGLKANQSFLSLDNLDIDEASGSKESGGESEDGDINSSFSDENSKDEPHNT